MVIASGPYSRPDVPPVAAAVPSQITSMTPAEYRNPAQLEAGGVLVVGAAATGIQLADEIHRSGRPVTLAVGGHVRLPRMYRGMDIMWWLDAAGVLDERYDEVDDIVRARNVASFQLVGSPSRSTIDLNALQDMGIRLVGRLGGITDSGTAQFSGSLLNQCTLADLKLRRLLDTLDEWATGSGLADEAPPPERFAPTRVPDDPPLMLPLRPSEFRSIIWATGFRAAYPWLEVPVLDAKGNVRHDGGVTAAPGPVSHRRQLPPPAQVQLHRRCRSGRRGADGPPHGVPRPAGHTRLTAGTTHSLTPHDTRGYQMGDRRPPSAVGAARTGGRTRPTFAARGSAPLDQLDPVAVGVVDDRHPQPGPALDQRQGKRRPRRLTPGHRPVQVVDVHGHPPDPGHVRPARPSEPAGRRRPSFR